MLLKKKVIIIYIRLDTGSQSLEARTILRPKAIHIHIVFIYTGIMQVQIAIIIDL